MKAEEIRMWLGAYVLVLTALLGGYLLLAGGRWLLPLQEGDVTSSFQIVIPFLLGQVVMVYRFFARDRPPRPVRGMPPFFVKMPLLLATLILLVTFVLMAAGGVLVRRERDGTG